MERQTLFVDLILPLPLNQLFTYRIPHGMNDKITIGKRVIVQFGSRKYYTGIVYNIHSTAPNYKVIKYIVSILDESPIVNQHQLTLWEWIAGYYMCSLGEVMNAALPAALKLQSETTITPVTDEFIPQTNLDLTEIKILDELNHRKKLTLSEISKITGLSNIIPVIQKLYSHELVNIEENIGNDYKPKTITYIKLHNDYATEEDLTILLDSFTTKAPKQFELLLRYIELSRVLTDTTIEISKKDLLEKSNANEQQLRELLKKNILETYFKTTSRFDSSAIATKQSLSLTPAQKTAFNSIKQSFKEKDIVLLHGITGSGKTEIYIQLIYEALAQNQQVLYLMPEIALTTQIISRLQQYFGNRIGVYHSKFNNNQRAEIWNSLLSNDNNFNIIIGARSATFLPFTNLGLVIIDEEHDPSFKQHDPAPRYNGRDTAIYYAKLYGAKVVLGTATPSIETYYNALQGKFGLIPLTERYMGTSLPDITLINIPEEKKRKRMHQHYSATLIHHIEETLKNKEQIILFQNRRGHSLYLECKHCQWTPSCKHCDVSLTYHKKQNRLICHYCGYSINIPNKCPQCNHTDIRMKGFGTEKIEEDIPLFFPNIRIERMDLDSTRNKTSHQRIIEEFEKKHIDLLIGTQMVTKGLDFDHVGLVGIINADNMLSFPDFRSHERCFQLITQVSGRAGRRAKTGKVMIQTAYPEHPVIQFAANHDYKNFYLHQIKERQEYLYPPFYRLILVRIKHREADIALQAAKEINNLLKMHKTFITLGPQWALVPRVQSLYIAQCLIKLPVNNNLLISKQLVQKTLSQFEKDTAIKNLRIQLDVDPQ